VRVRPTPPTLKLTRSTVGPLGDLNPSRTCSKTLVLLILRLKDLLVPVTRVNKRKKKNWAI